ncbi:Hemolysin-type calcium-binding repeat-containing protein, partial [Pseudovibrio denitrificans]
ADTLDGGPGNDILSYGGSPTGVSVNLTTGAVSGGHAEGDTISNFETIEGSSYNDVLIGDEQNNSFYGHRGNDRLEGKGGNDTLNAYGGGNDFLDGGSGFDIARYRWSKHAMTINLAAPSQNTGDAAGDTYVSIEGVMGSDAYGDTIIGNASDNKLWGYGGNDTLIGAAGNDRLYGGKGNDTFVFEGPSFGQDVIEDFAAGSGKGDIIWLKYSTLTSFEKVKAQARASGSNTVIQFDAGNTITLRNVKPSQLHANNFKFTNGTRARETKENWLKVSVSGRYARFYLKNPTGSRSRSSSDWKKNGPWVADSVSPSFHCDAANGTAVNYFETVQREKVTKQNGSSFYTDWKVISTRTSTSSKSKSASSSREC